MTRRFPALSNSIERGLVRPVATRAAWYPEAMDGFIEFVGVRLGQLEGDWLRAGTKKRPSKAANETADILEASKVSISGLQWYSNKARRRKHMSEGKMTTDTLRNGH